MNEFLEAQAAERERERESLRLLGLTSGDCVRYVRMKRHHSLASRTRRSAFALINLAAFSITMSSEPQPTSKTQTSVFGRDLVLTRTINASREKVYAAWTQPELFKQWIAPRPYTTPHAEFDVRPGGASFFIMRGPDGAEIPCPGVFLEVVPNERIVSTDAYTKAWEPSEKPFMTLTLTFEEAGPARTRYTARISHWTIADRENHEKMSFHDGWLQCTEQLAELVEND